MPLAIYEETNKAAKKIANDIVKEMLKLKQTGETVCIGN